jgi:hypothetical protein
MAAFVLVALVSALLACVDGAAAVESLAWGFADADGSPEGELPAASSALDTLSADGGFIVGWGADAGDSLYGGLLAAVPLLDTVSADGGFIVGCGTGRESTVAVFASPFEP